MSFLKISDPAKTDLIVKEYLELKKNIQDNLLSEIAGEQQLQTDLSKFFKPITETQKATTREITEELKPIKEGIEAITFPACPSIQASEKPLEGKEDAPYVGEIAKTYLKKFTTKDEADTMYGLYDKAGKFYIGNILAIIVDNDLVVGKDEYEGTPGLWEVIVSKEPKNFTEEDYENYANLMIKTIALHRGNDPESKYQKSSSGYKWKNILRDIWLKEKELKFVRESQKEKKKYEERFFDPDKYYYPEGVSRGYLGKGVVVIPSDPNALLERLDLLLASKEAGNTGVRNELVSICDELKKQGVFDTRSYKKLNSIIKKCLVKSIERLLSSQVSKGK